MRGGRRYDEDEDEKEDYVNDGNNRPNNGFSLFVDSEIYKHTIIVGLNLDGTLSIRILLNYYSYGYRCRKAIKNYNRIPIFIRNLKNI